MSRNVTARSVLLVVFSASLCHGVGRAKEPPRLDFRHDIQPLLQARCYTCHGPKRQRGGLRLDLRSAALAGGDSGRILIPGKSSASVLIRRVASNRAAERMPPRGKPLTPEQITRLRTWVDEGAVWPADADRHEIADRRDWWSLQPLHRPAVPDLSRADAAWVRNPIDAFIRAKQIEKGLTPAPEADRRTLIRRLYFDLVGLPPSPGDVDAFVADRDPRAYEKLVDRLLASRAYGERWARHWLDIVHYGDTHGYDKDKVRPHAWPYRDYVIRSFNEDKPYTRFVREQLAGDVFYPGTRDGVVALGFLAAGPWDYVGQVELRDGTLDKRITRNLDRDDMVTTTMNTFTSLTAQCARCHDHKFDPITQEDYYSVQAVFAAVDRADRPFDLDPITARRRHELEQTRQGFLARQKSLDEQVLRRAGPRLADIDRRIALLTRTSAGVERPEFGYHSGIEPHPDVAKWVQVDLGRSLAIAQIVYVGCHDTFNNIGAGFGFPARYRIEISDDPTFHSAVAIVADHTHEDAANPGVRPQTVAVGGRHARYVRFTATRLAPRQNDYIFALAELSVLTGDGRNAASGAPVTALDSIEAPPRWSKKNLVDGYYYGMSGQSHLAELTALAERRARVIASVGDEVLERERVTIERGLKEVSAALAALPAKELVFAAATDFPAMGSLVPTHGRPRPIYVLRRGSEKDRLGQVQPGTVSCIRGLPSRFAPHAPEGERRAALANWIVDPRNPLTWRSIVNRIWQYHFGQGIVATPNDFGHMGSKPTHPELLDWLAVAFRDGGGSVKELHRLIVTSATYRQSCAFNERLARVDGSNQYLWRMNRRRLEAEEIRDAVLAVSGQLNRRMFGPGFRAFGFRDDHSPHYKYEEFNPSDPASHRRSIYRFIVRSVPDPFMEALDCADPSQAVARRNETLTPLQALALLNDRFMVRMAECFADRVRTTPGGSLAVQVTRAYRLAMNRSPTAEERKLLVECAQKYGMPSVCRLIFNTTEFVFID